MDKCNVCGLDRNKHTQLPHRFVTTPPNPDQGILFDVGSLYPVEYLTSSPSLKEFAKKLMEGDEVSEYRKMIFNAEWAETEGNLGFKFEDRSTVEYSENMVLAMQRSERMFLSWPRGMGKTQWGKDWLATQEAITVAKRTPPSEHQLYLNRMAYRQDEFVPKTDRMQAKDIPEDRLIKLIQDFTDMGKPTHLAALCDAWPLIPRKVIQAKLRRLERRNITEGCYCGCSTQNRVLTEADRAHLHNKKRAEFHQKLLERKNKK